MKRFDLKALVVDKLDIIKWDDLEFRAEKMQWHELLNVEEINFTHNLDNFIITKEHIGKRFDNIVVAEFGKIKENAERSASIMAEALKKRLVDGDKEKVTADWVMSLPGQVREIFNFMLNNGGMPDINDEDRGEG